MDKQTIDNSTPWELLAQHTIECWGADWCGDCLVIKRRFEEHGIQYSYVDIDSEPSLRQTLVQKTGVFSIPFLLLDGNHWIRGWHQEAPGNWSDDIFREEYSSLLIK